MIIAYHKEVYKGNVTTAESNIFKTPSEWDVTERTRAGLSKPLSGGRSQPGAAAHFYTDRHQSPSSQEPSREAATVGLLPPSGKGSTGELPSVVRQGSKIKGEGWGGGSVSRALAM